MTYLNYNIFLLTSGCINLGLSPNINSLLNVRDSPHFLRILKPKTIFSKLGVDFYGGYKMKNITTEL